MKTKKSKKNTLTIVCKYCFGVFSFILRNAILSGNIQFDQFMKKHSTWIYNFL